MAEWGKIEDIRERMALLKKGALVKTFRVEAITARGVPFTLDLSEEVIEDKDEVERLCRERAEHLDALLEL